MHRGTPSAFGTDSKALSWAKQLVGGGRDLQLPAMQRSFVLMPYMHSEELADQEVCRWGKMRERRGSGGSGLGRAGEGALASACMGWRRPAAQASVWRSGSRGF